MIVELLSRRRRRREVNFVFFAQTRIGEVVVFGEDEFQTITLFKTDRQDWQQLAVVKSLLMTSLYECFREYRAACPHGFTPIFTVRGVFANCCGVKAPTTFSVVVNGDWAFTPLWRGM